MILNRRILHAALAAGLLFPIFFTLSGHIYRSPLEPMYDSGGVVTAVPLPIALPVCFLGIFILWWRRDVFTAAMAVAGFLGALLLSDAVTGGWSLAKLAQNLQYFLPACALLLGLLWDDYRTLAVTWLALVAVFVPAQIAFGYWDTGILLLHHDMGFFSIYQHRQFIPVFFVAAYLLGLFALWDTLSHRWMLMLLGAVMAFYVGLAISTLPSFLLVAGVVAFSMHRKAARWLPLLVIASLMTGAILVSGSAAAKQKYAIFSRQSQGPASSFQLPFGLPRVYVPINIERRLSDWKLHSEGITERYRSAFFGHAAPMDRKIATSAHNYYLDLAYNSGLISLLPILLLIGYTAFLLRRPLDLETLGLALVVAFLIVLDNNFKVTFKQPYPGVLGFFLWGLLLQRLGVSAPSAARDRTLSARPAGLYR